MNSNKNFIDLTDSFLNVFTKYKEILLSLQKYKNKKLPHPLIRVSEEEQKQPENQSVNELTSKENIKNLNLSQIKQEYLDELYQLLKKFLKLLDKIKNKPILIQGFLDRQYPLISKLKFFLLSLKTNDAISYHDKIFVKIFKMNTKVPFGITITFEEFVKGITYFHTEEEAIKKTPIYHRIASCFDSSPSFIKNHLRCTGFDSFENLQDKRSHIFKCYIERLIYDHMFRHLSLHLPFKIDNYELKQNIQHKYQLNQRKSNFKSCFWFLNIQIYIHYENLFPTILTIQYFDEDTLQLTKTEVFEKITVVDEYGNTRYLENIYYKCIINDIVVIDEIRKF